MSADHDDDLRQAWVDDLRVLGDEVRSALGHRALWREVADAVPESWDVPDGLWLIHYTMLYLHSQASAVRRIGRKSGRAVALDGVISDIRRHTGEFEACRVTTIPVDPHSDLRRLREVVRPVGELVDTTIAHRDPQGGLPKPGTWERIDAALDVMCELIGAYTQALTAVMPDFTPPLDPAWRAVFTKPLLDPFGRPLGG